MAIRTHSASVKVAPSHFDDVSIDAAGGRRGRIKININQLAQRF
jgi:hypothetical protein